jgi:hypothetical protein
MHFAAQAQVQSQAQPSSSLTHKPNSEASRVFDEAAVDAAVAVALQLASNSSSAADILQVLIGDSSQQTNKPSSRD